MNTFTQQLNQFIARVEAATEIEDKTLHAIGQRWVKRVHDSFRTSVDPYGKPWAPIYHREGQPLVDTSRLRSSISYEVTGNSLIIGTPVHYAEYHQFGTEHIRQRAFMPTDDNLPKVWAQDAITELNKLLQEALSR